MGLFKNAKSIETSLGYMVDWTQTLEHSVCFSSKYGIAVGSDWRAFFHCTRDGTYYMVGLGFLVDFELNREEAVQMALLFTRLGIGYPLKRPLISHT